MSFTETKIKAHHLSLRKILYNFGTNDSSYYVRYKENGIERVCPYYRVWSSMIKRCYTNKKCYEGCFVSDDWALFSNFKKWMMNQDWKGNDLDKDLIKPGNKEYSSSTCAFVSKKLNSMFKRGVDKLYPRYIGYNPANKLYWVKAPHYYKERIYLGSFTIYEDAAVANINNFITYITDLKPDIKDSRVFQGVKKHTLIFINSHGIPLEAEGKILNRYSKL